VRFPNRAGEPKTDASSRCVAKDQGKCILCGDCVRMCNEVQSVGAIDFAHRGSKMTIGTAFDIPLAESNCVGCGQCAAVCPTGAITVKNDADAVWRALDDPDLMLTAQVAPAVRVAIGREFGLGEGGNAMGLIVAALRRIGFEEVYDTSAGADLTVLEEAKEFLGRLEEDRDLPLFTSCCPAWINFCESRHPELMKNVSSCRSPMQMLASVVKEQYRNVYRRVVHVAVMPCTAKKCEAARREFARDGGPIVDHVLTTQELIRMIKESGLAFAELEAEAVNDPFGSMSGAGVIFGVSGGVTEAVLRRVSSDKSRSELNRIAMAGVRGMEGVKETTVDGGKRELRIAVVSGLGNADKLIGEVQAGRERYDFIEVMACPGGCVSGAGQPFADAGQRGKRGGGLYAADKMCGFRRSEDNPLMLALYRGILKDRTRELLHVRYGGASLVRD
jgi:NADH-quinone oxidoreductase subunit G